MIGNIRRDREANGIGLLVSWDEGYELAWPGDLTPGIIQPAVESRRWMIWNQDGGKMLFGTVRGSHPERDINFRLWIHMLSQSHFFRFGDERIE